MGITPLFTDGDVHKMMQAKTKAVNDAIIFQLSRLGEMCVNEARDFGDYMDQTGNLRSSVGYVVMTGGEIVKYDFKLSEKDTVGKADKQTGLETAKTYAAAIAAGYPVGNVLIVVAGMNYAAYVETRRNVLSSAEHLAQTELPKLLSQLKRKVEA